MDLLATAIGAVERLDLPDAVTRAGIDFLVAQQLRQLQEAPTDAAAFARDMEARAVAELPQEANRQHYELPPEFFAQVLGPRRKYSSCLYPTGRESLAEAEIVALDETIAHAELADGQHILELGCGWGSLTLTMAERFPAARITSVSNSRPQRRHILSEAVRRNLTNVEVITADMNAFTPPGRYDRVVSVEMFEHMSNWRRLLAGVRDWLQPDGKLFIHIFTHASVPYRFSTEDQRDWIAHHFFAGGIMPSHDLPAQFPDLFSIEAQWRWSGLHYQRTALQWLANFDSNRAAIDPILVQVYGRDARLWRRRWRLFFLATAGLFGHAGGREWGVSHYLLRPNAH